MMAHAITFDTHRTDTDLPVCKNCGLPMTLGMWLDWERYPCPWPALVEALKDDGR